MQFYRYYKWVNSDKWYLATFQSVHAWFDCTLAQKGIFLFKTNVSHILSICRSVAVSVYEHELAGTLIIQEVESCNLGELF